MTDHRILRRASSLPAIATLVVFLLPLLMTTGRAQVSPGALNEPQRTQDGNPVVTETNRSKQMEMIKLLAKNILSGLIISTE